MEFYKIIIIVVVLYIILYNLTLGFGIFNKKRTIIIYDCDVNDLKKLKIHSVLNKYPHTSIDIEYMKDKKLAIIRSSFDVLLLSGIDKLSRVQIDDVIYNGITDSILMTTFEKIDVRLEGEFDRQVIEGIWENTLMKFPDSQPVFRMKKSTDEDFGYVFRSGKMKELNVVFLR